MGIMRPSTSVIPDLKPGDIILPEKMERGFKSSYIQKTHSDLRSDPKYQDEAEKFLGWLAEERGAGDKIGGALLPNKIRGGLLGQGIFETLRDEEMRLGTAIDRAMIMDDAPEDIKETYRYLKTEFEESKAGSFGEIMKATWDRGVDVFVDPINILFMLLGTRLGGTGAAALRGAAGASAAATLKVASSPAGRKGILRALHNISASNAGRAGAFEGAVWTGAENAARQDINISTEIQDSFSGGDFALSTGLGFGLGAVAGHYLGGLFGPRTSNKIDETPLIGRSQTSDSPGILTGPTVRQPGVESKHPDVPDLPELAEDVDTILTGMLNKVKLTTTSRLGRNFYDDLKNPEVDRRLLKRIMKGLNIPEVEAASAIIGLKQVLFKTATRKGEEISINRVIDIDKEISSEILEGFQKLGLSKKQIRKAIDLTVDHYGPVDKYIVGKDGTRIKAVTLIDPKDSKRIAAQLASKMGGGRHTADVLTDKLAEESAEQGRSIVSFKQSLLSSAINQASKLNAIAITGKVSGRLDPHKNLSPNIVGSMQRKTTSEVGQEWRRGEVGLRDLDDFGTYQSKVFGEHVTPWQKLYEALKLTGKNKKLKESLDNLIVDGIRHGTVVLDKTKIPLIPELKTALIGVIKEGKSGLYKFGRELQSKGIVDELLTDYFPASWNRAAIEKNEDEFVRLLLTNNVKHRNADGVMESIDTIEKATALKNGMLDIKYHIGNDTNRGTSFFYSRTLDISDEFAFSKFLDTDINSVLTSYYYQGAKAVAKHDIFGVRNLDDFIRIWGKAAQKEIKANGGTSKQAKAAVDDMEEVYKSITGEGLERYGPTAQFLADSYMLANRMALLPLSTLSSLTEIFLNISKAGPSKAFRGYRDALLNGSKKVYNGSMDDLQKFYGLTRKEAKAELNKMGIALDQALADYADRLGGDALTNPRMRKISNKFFRFTLLDQWTKTVQMTSYITGRRLIGEHLEDIMAHQVLIAAGKTSRRVQSKIDDLKDLGVDYKEGIKWIENGASFDDPFYRKVKEGAGAYTNSVILNPTSASGLRPSYMSNPQTAILGQLLGYPAAFTNTILKGMAKQTVRNPETFLTQHLPAAAIMTGAAVLTNGIRSSGESFEKEPHEIIGDALVRWGGNGLPADMWMRGRDAARMYQNPVGWASGLGPLQGDLFKIMATGNIFSVLAGKIPGTGAMNAVFNPIELTEDWTDDWRKFQREWDRWGKEVIVPEKERVPSRPFKKGGEVLDVPQVPVEPDERIDKMTGLPYNIQAGGAFIDQEDRQGFAIGTVASKAAPVLKSVLNEALDFLANKGENVTISRLGKRLSERGVRKDEMKSAGIDDVIEDWKKAEKSIEPDEYPLSLYMTERQIDPYSYTTTRKGNIAITPEGLKNLKRTRDDKPLVESNFVTARETLKERYVQDADEGSWNISEDTIFENLYENYSPKDINRNTFEVIVFRDPRVKDTTDATHPDVSAHFQGINTFAPPKRRDAKWRSDWLGGNPYSYHVRADTVKDVDSDWFFGPKERRRVFEMQTDLVNSERAEAITSAISDINAWKDLGYTEGKGGIITYDGEDIIPLPSGKPRQIDHVYDVLLAFGVDKKHIKFTEQASKRITKDMKRNHEISKSFKYNYDYIVDASYRMKTDDVASILGDRGQDWNQLAKRLNKVADDLTKTGIDTKLANVIKDYINPVTRAEHSELTEKIQTFLYPTMNSLFTVPLPNINVSQNIINRMVAEAKEKKFSSVSFLIGKDTPVSRKYMGLKSGIYDPKDRGYLQRSVEVQKNYETTIAGQVIATAKKIGAKYNWDEEGYLIIHLPEKDFTLPMFKNQGGKVIGSLQRSRRAEGGSPPPFRAYFKPVKDTLKDNKDKEFVQRVLNPALNDTLKKTKDVARNETHKMGAEFRDGRWVVFPTVVNKNGTLVKLKQNKESDEAYNYAVENNELIDFGKDEAQATWFSHNNYKTKEFKEHFR